MPGLRRAAVVRSMVVALVAAVVVVGSSCTAEAAHVNYRYVIPAGTTGLILTGRAPQIIPPDLTVRVGDSITIVNDDDYDQEVGPYLVKAGTTMTQRFASPGVIEGVCRMSAGGRLTVRIVPAD